MTSFVFLIFFDPPKPGIIETIRELKHLGVSLKIITGDNRLLAANVSQQVELLNPNILTGGDLHQMNDEALLKRVNEVDVFAEVEPNHKERIILALKKAGQVVGYMGDGINDASALHTADVGISVDSAVDVAKEAADIVLLEKDLRVLVATTDQFRTGWFIESVISASATVLVIRTRRPFFRSKPGKYLRMATLLIVGVTILLPFTPLAGLLGFRPLPMTILLVIGMIVVFYAIAAEIAKRSFYENVSS